MRYAHFMPLSALLLSLVVTACALAPPTSSLVKDVAVMTNHDTPGNAGQSVVPLQPKLTVEQVLARLIELIRNSKSINDFTKEYINKMMGVEFVTYRPGYHAFGEQVTPYWWYSLEKDDSDQYGPQFVLRFAPEDDRKVDQFSVADICRLDFGNFSDELMAMGFAREPYYDAAPPPAFGEEQLPHGPLLYYSFSRMRDGMNEMIVQVYLRGGVTDHQSDVVHDCVEMIRVY